MQGSSLGRGALGCWETMQARFGPRVQGERGQRTGPIVREVGEPSLACIRPATRLTLGFVLGFRLVFLVELGLGHEPNKRLKITTIKRTSHD